MKNNYKYLTIPLISLFLILGLSSCFKDLSTRDDNDIPHYIILDEENRFSVSAIVGETIGITPTICKIIKGDTIRTIADEELDYCWYIGLNPVDLDTTSIVLSNERNLNVKVPVAANANQYTLGLKITDKIYGVTTIGTWTLRQSSIFNNGLLIMDTDDNGLASDVSIIMSAEVSKQFNGKGDPKIFHGIYSLSNNGEKINGEVSFCSEGHVDYGIQFTFICEKAKQMSRVESTDFVIMDKNQDKFIVPRDNFAPTYLGIGYSQLWLVNNGSLNCQNYQSTDKYSYALEADNKGYYCSKWYSHSKDYWDGSSELQGVVYDELNGRFLRMPGKFESKKRLYPFNLYLGGAFDPNNVQNKTCEMAGTLKDKRKVFMLRDKSTQNLSMYVLSGDLYNDNGKMGLEILDMSSLPGVNEVVSYVISSSELTIYYATKTKIYALLMTGGVFRSEERYGVPTGELITAMSMMTNQSVSYINKTEIIDGVEINSKIYTANRLLSIGIYNEATKEGRVRNQYISSLGAGIFSSEDVWEYKGFDKITCIKAVEYQW